MKDPKEYFTGRELLSILPEKERTVIERECVNFMGYPEYVKQLDSRYANLWTFIQVSISVRSMLTYFILGDDYPMISQLVHDGLKENAERDPEFYKDQMELISILKDYMLENPKREEVEKDTEEV